MHWLHWLLSGGVIQIWPTGINYNIQDNDLYLIVSTFITVTHIWWHCPTFITLIFFCTNSILMSDLHLPKFTIWPTIDDTDLHLMTMTYILWHWPISDGINHTDQERCVDVHQSFTVLKLWLGIVQQSLWSLWGGKECVQWLIYDRQGLSIFTSKHKRADVMTDLQKGEGENYINIISSFLEDKVCRHLHFIQIKSLHRLLHGSWSLFLKIIMPYCFFQWTGIQYMTQ